MPLQISITTMKIQKLKSESVGTHYPEQAIILTDKGEMFVTQDELSAEGYELLKFQTYDLEQLTTIVNAALKGNPIRSSAKVEIEANTVFVSSISNLYKVDGYSEFDVLNRVLGGFEGQVISIVGNGTALTINDEGNIRLNTDFILQNEYSILRIQKLSDEWVEVSRNSNQ